MNVRAMAVWAVAVVMLGWPARLCAQLDGYPQTMPAVRAFDAAPAEPNRVAPAAFQEPAPGEEMVGPPLMPADETWWFNGQPVTPPNMPPPPVRPDWDLQLLPASLIYKSYLAGPKESRFGTQIVDVSTNATTAQKFWDPTLGARVGLLRGGERGSYFPEGFQLDAEGSAQARLAIDEDVDLQSVDFRGGVPFTIGWGRQQTKFAYYHLKAHLGDEFLMKNGNFHRLNYARDVLVLGHSIYLTDRLRAYGEVGWAFYTDVSEPWEVQFGFERAPKGPTGIWGEPFWAVNVSLREELDWDGNFVVQAGWSWKGREGDHLLRLGFHYLNGYSNHYSFYNFREEQIGFGAWYDF